ncbi:hypothetical protein ACIRQY_34570 [Streptomyces sp. NPDC101490]|uniref:hypothetical protein n=1 Tax=Streptomyces sp. NPDC101490 TaxID=3366143 RepID=UPI0037FF8503
MPPLNTHTPGAALPSMGRAQWIPLPQSLFDTAFGPRRPGPGNENAPAPVSADGTETEDPS